MPDWETETGKTQGGAVSAFEFIIKHDYPPYVFTVWIEGYMGSDCWQPNVYYCLEQTFDQILRQHRDDRYLTFLTCPSEETCSRGIIDLITVEPSPCYHRDNAP